MVYGPYDFKCRFEDTNYLLFMIVLLRIRYVLFRLLEDHWTQLKLKEHGKKLEHYRPKSDMSSVLFDSNFLKNLTLRVMR